MHTSLTAFVFYHLQSGSIWGTNSHLNEISISQNKSGLCSSDVKEEHNNAAEEESSRQLQLADGGLDVETGREEKVGKKMEENRGNRSKPDKM